MLSFFLPSMLMLSNGIFAEPKVKPPDEFCSEPPGLSMAQSTLKHSSSKHHYALQASSSGVLESSCSRALVDTTLPPVMAIGKSHNTTLLLNVIGMCFPRSEASFG